MKKTILTQRINYDGSQLKPLWAYTQGIEGDSIVVFRGPMNITDILDLEDRDKSIRGDDLVHFIVERFDSPASMRLAYYMQRLLIVCIQETLQEQGVKVKVERKGDDLLVEGKKLTVSIASAGVSSEKIHCAINITTQGTPQDVETTSLEELGIKEEDWQTIAEKAARKFIEETDKIEMDIRKTRSL